MNLVPHLEIKARKSEIQMEEAEKEARCEY
jgi:hypothetical protein